jgi:hypothetical protein
MRRRISVRGCASPSSARLAPYLSSRCTGTTMRDCLRGSGPQHRPQSVIEAYDNGREMESSRCRTSTARRINLAGSPLIQCWRAHRLRNSFGLGAHLVCHTGGLSVIAGASFADARQPTARPAWRHVPRPADCRRPFAAAARAERIAIEPPTREASGRHRPGSWQTTGFVFLSYHAGRGESCAARNRNSCLASCADAIVVASIPPQRVSCAASTGIRNVNAVNCPRMASLQRMLA